MFTEAKILGDFAVGQPIGHQASDVFFALREKLAAIGVLESQGQSLAKRLQQVAEIFAIGPHLALVNDVDTLTESFDRLVPENDAVGSATKGVDHEFGIARVEKHDGARFGLHEVKFTQNAIAFERPIVQPSTNHSNVRLVFLEACKRIGGAYRTRDNDDARAFRAKNVFDKLAVQKTRFCDQDVNRVARLDHAIHALHLNTPENWKIRRILDRRREQIQAAIITNVVVAVSTCGLRRIPRR
ncbi:MAG TPA: hypothetical protein VMB02_12230 [Candidatus Aquilonibacter sp.]|nr:hypothetical protein [Candidatus Aquilonibacter sp.]